MVILVTGSAGFIGSYVAKALLSSGHRVIGIDNFNTYYDVVLKMRRHAELAALPGYVGLHGDISDYQFLSDVVGKHRPDRVCHLAAQPGIRYSIENPQAYGESNLSGFLNVLEVCRHNAVDRLVFASSSSVYGGNNKVPFSESDRVDHPVNLYAATKRANELMAHSYAHLYGLQTIGLRFFTVYGPAGRPDMAYWLFTEAMLKGQEIRVFNNGNMQRDFTYIDDIVSGVTSALLKDGLGQYEIFNLGNSKPEQLMELITILGNELGVQPRLKMLPMQPGDVCATFADITKAEKTLGYSPQTTLKAGICRFVRWYLACRTSPKSDKLN